MATEFIERAARAMAEALNYDFDKSDFERGDGEPMQFDFILGVRAVLTAIREPSEAVVTAGLDLGPDRASDDYWEAMIDAAIKETMA